MLWIERGGPPQRTSEDGTLEPQAKGPRRPAGALQSSLPLPGWPSTRSNPGAVPGVCAARCSGLRRRCPPADLEKLSSLILLVLIAAWSRSMRSPSQRPDLLRTSAGERPPDNSSRTTFRQPPSSSCRHDRRPPASADRHRHSLDLRPPTQQSPNSPNLVLLFNHQSVPRSTTPSSHIHCPKPDTETN